MEPIDPSKANNLNSSAPPGSNSSIPANTAATPNNPEYKNPFKPVPDLIQALQEKGLIIEDDDYPVIQQFFTEIGYFRFKTYLWHFYEEEPHTVLIEGKKLIPGSNKRETITKEIVNYKKISPFKLKQSTSFKDVLKLYQFDAYLRKIVFDAATCIEITAKSIISNTMCKHEGAHWYLIPSCFSSKYTRGKAKKKNSKAPGSYYQEFLHSLEKKCRRSAEPYFKDYRQRYRSPELPPSWLMMELISFGEASSLFKNIASIEYRSEIASYFKSYDNIFRSWIGSVATVRNLCAHNQNLAGHKILFPPSLPVGQNHELLVTLPQTDFIEEVIDTRKLYATLCCLQSILDALNNPTKFKGSLLHAIDEYSVDLSLYGFTPNWRNEPLWQI